MVQEWKTRAPRAASEPLRRPRRQDWLLWWPRRPYRPCTGFLRGHRRHPQIGVYITPFGDVPERTGCGLFLRAEKQAVACVSRAESQKARPARRANRSFTILSGSCCKSEGDLPSSKLSDGDGHSPSRKTGWPPHRGRSEETSGRASIPGNRSSPRGSSIRTCAIWLVRSRSGP
jgi:hypothetical protein